MIQLVPIETRTGTVEMVAGFLDILDVGIIIYGRFLHERDKLEFVIRKKKFRVLNFQACLQ